MSVNQHKNLVLSFYQKVLGQGDIEYAHAILAADYIQHNPNIKTGKAGVIEAVQFLKQLPPTKKTSPPFMRMIAEKNYVAVHLSVTFAGQHKIVLDLFRIENGKIAEHWDAIKDCVQEEEITGPIPEVFTSQVKDHKKLVKCYSEVVLRDRNFYKLSDFVANDLIQHHPFVENGRAALSKHYENIELNQVHRCIGEGDFVLTQSSGRIQEKPAVLYDIYRLDEGRIVEHWSVNQLIPNEMEHGNGMI